MMLFMLASGCSRDSVDTGETIFATVNGVRLTESGLRDLVPEGFFSMLTQEQIDEIINEWVNGELLYQEALRKGIDQTPEIRKILENTKKTLLTNELLEQGFGSLPKPETEELRLYYEMHQQEFVLSEREYRVRYAGFETRRDAETFARDAGNAAGFAKLARERSNDPSARTDGDIGIVSQDLVSPEFWQGVEAAAKRRGANRISEPFRVENRWGCVLIEEIYEPGKAKPFEAVSDRVRDMYMMEIREKALDELLQNLASGAKITYDYKNESGK